MASQLKYLIYVSKESKKLNEDEINQILKTSWSNNSDNNVTGMLLYVEGRFFQVLEGEIEVIDKLFATISKDSRHTNVVVVDQGELDKRIFENWKMKFNAITEEEFSQMSGISSFHKLFGLLPQYPRNPAYMFVRKFMNKKFPSESWWKD